jgi:hypothetical protein
VTKELELGASKIDEMGAMMRCFFDGGWHYLIKGRVLSQAPQHGAQLQGGDFACRSYQENLAQHELPLIN